MAKAKSNQYEIEISPSAQRDLKRLKNNQVVLRSVDASIRSLGANPFPNGCEKLSGTEGGYRIRDGEYRILYSVEESVKIVTITRVRDRKDVYKH